MGQTQQAVAEAAAGVFGGYRLGVADTAVLLTEAGRAAAPVPALATLAMGVLPVTRWGSRDQQQALLAGVAAGDALLTAAVRETSEPMPPGPATTVTPDGGTVSGVKVGVPHAAAASWILVPASLGPGGTGIAVVAPSAPGVTLRRTPSSSGAPEYTLRLDGAPVVHVLGNGRAVAALSACWRLDTGRDAADDTEVAAYWLAEEAPAAMRACHHLHGGTGMDVSYPLHRYSALAKDLVSLVGGADYRLGRLGAGIG